MPGVSVGKLSMVLGLAAGTSLAAYEVLLRRPRPRTRGLLSLRGLASAAEVVRDAWGVPHVRAASLADAVAAQGFLHAQDRLWQMEVNRRTASGQLAELFGNPALAADRFLRRIGLRRAAEHELAQLAEPVQQLLAAYCAGVNAGMAALDGLPIEFRLLRHFPEPWTAVDSLAHGKLLAWSLSSNWETELLRARLTARLGPERAARLEPGYPPGHPLTTPELTSRLAADVLADYLRAAPYLADTTVGASNAWAVSGERSASGGPLLAADPHLRLQFPAIWHEIHLTAPAADAAGAGMPGMPGILIGHNGHVAWGLTAAPVDVQDLYLERLNPADYDQYEVNGAWQTAQVSDDVIHVRGRHEPAIERVRTTRHGPILATVDGVGVALRWTGHDADGLLDTLTALPAQHDWAGVRAAVARLGAPPVNIVCADSAGTIAYQLAGRVPTRPGRGGLLPVPGWTDEHEWGPPIPFDELPASVNPPGGVVLNANNRPMADDYPHYLGNEWANGYRAKRIADMLSDRERFTVADFARMQLDVLSLPGLRLQAQASRLRPDWLSPLARQTLDLLRAWDGEMRSESGGAAVYGRLMPTLQSHLLRPILGDLYEEFIGIGKHEVGAINAFWGRATPLVLSLVEDPAVGGLYQPAATAPGDATPAEALLVAALEQTASELAQLLGPELITWRWGRLNRVSWRHPLNALKLLRPLLSRGPYELGGDLDTVNYTATVPVPARGNAGQAWVPAFRLVVDLADPTRSVSLLAGGQWGQPASRHYADQIGAWRSGRSHALMFNRGVIDKAAIDRLLLVPERPLRPIKAEASPRSAADA